MTKIEIAKFLAFYVSSTPSPNRARRAKTFKNIHLKVLAKFRCRIAAHLKGTIGIFGVNHRQPILFVNANWRRHIRFILKRILSKLIKAVPYNKVPF